MKKLPIPQIDTSKINDLILKAIFKKIGHTENKSVSQKEIRIECEQIDADTFFDAIADLVSERLLLDRGQGYVAFTRDGWEKANRLYSVTASVRQNTPTIRPGVEPRQKKTAEKEPNPLTENLAWLIELMTPNLSALNLPPQDHQKAQQDLANLKTLITDKPNPVLLKAVCNSLKRVTEGPIGERLASGNQPAVWGAVLALFGQL